MGDWIEEGRTAPDFSLPADDGTTVRLKDLKGRPVVVYFYPKDDTPGCTREACAFRDRKSELAKLGATVLGVSADDVRSHGKFRDKYALNFPLLADVDHHVAEAFGAWREKQNYGRTYWGIQRSTFLIDAAGKVCKAWRSVKVDGHDAQVIAALRELSGAASASAAPSKSRAGAKTAATKKPAPTAKSADKKPASRPAARTKSSRPTKNKGK